MDPMDEDSPAERRGAPVAPSATDAQAMQGLQSAAAPAPSPGPAGSSAAASSSSAPTPSGPSSASSASKRRRGLGVVTPNACTECRKKRAKCDGQRPCGRCKVQKDVECVYEIPVRQSKENLRSEIEQLRRQQRTTEAVLAALVRPDVWQDVLERLRSGQTVESISEWLGGSLPSGGGAVPSFPRPSAPPGSFTAVAGFAGAGAGASSFTPASSRASGVGAVVPLPQDMKQEPEHPSPWAGPPFSSQTLPGRSNSQPDVMSWSSDANRPPQSSVGSWVERMDQPRSSSEGQHYPGVGRVLSPDLPEMKVSARTWTNLTSDTKLVQHLLALYFCWEYPTFASLSKEHFLKDFKEGRARYCSSILVNALLALGCRFSSQPNTRANPDDPRTSGDHFFQECQRLFYQEKNHHNLTTIQALGIMSIREASCGRDSESWYYAGQSIRLAIEMGLHRLPAGRDDDDDETAVQAATFWGAFALDHAWSLATGSLPQCSCFPHLPPKPAIIDDIEASLWVPYTDDGAPLQRSCEQPSNVRSVYKCFCELSELVHQSLYLLHSPGRPLTSRDLLNIYTQYLNWYDRIPEVLRLGHNFTPAVLFTHMYYHFAILLLFRPLIKLRIIGSSILPRDVCIQAADAIQGLLRSYSQLYTLRRTPSFVPYFVLTSSIMHLAIGASPQRTPQGPRSDPARTHRGSQQPLSPRNAKMDAHVAEAISRGIADLTEMAPCHHFAKQALNILRYLAKKWNIDVTIPSESGGRPGDIKDDHESSVRPITTSLNFFAPNMTEPDFTCGWGGPSADGNESQSVAQAANTMDNPLFWPFPMQGRPMLPSGQLLKEAGFEPLE